MHVHKIGGKLLRDASGFIKAGEVIKSLGKGKFLIVVSAVAGDTRLLSKIFDAAKEGDTARRDELFEKFKMIHRDIISEIFPEKDSSRAAPIYSFWLFRDLEKCLNSKEFSSAEKAKILSYGELASSMTLYWYLKEKVFEFSKVTAISALDMIRTSGSLVEATVLAQQSLDRTYNRLHALFEKRDYIVTEGFIGRDHETNSISLLGFDGSDTSAAWFGSFLGAGSVTYWKDVKGVLKEDPSKNPNAVMFDEMTYQELKDHIDRGCNVIHPSAVAPLMEDNIPTIIRSFDHLGNPGTIIT